MTRPPGFVRRGLIGRRAASLARGAAWPIAAPGAAAAPAAPRRGGTARRSRGPGAHRPDPDRHPGARRRRGRRRQLGRDIAGVITNDLAPLRACSGRSTRRPSSSGVRHPTRRTSRTGRRSAPRRWSPAGSRPGRRPACGSNSGCGTCCRGQQIQGTAYTTDAGQLAPHRAHHQRRDLRAAARREGLFRHPHRLCRRHRPARPPHQAAGDHGPGRREQPLS